MSTVWTMQQEQGYSHSSCVMVSKPGLVYLLAVLTPLLISVTLGHNEILLEQQNTRKKTHDSSTRVRSPLPPLPAPACAHRISNFSTHLCSHPENLILRECIFFGVCLGGGIILFFHTLPPPHPSPPHSYLA